MSIKKGTYPSCVTTYVLKKPSSIVFRRIKWEFCYKKNAYIGKKMEKIENKYEKLSKKYQKIGFIKQLFDDLKVFFGGA